MPRPGYRSGVKIAITGAGGGIGSVLNRQLDRSAFEVTLIDLVAPEPGDPADRTVAADLRDATAAATALAGAEAVVHLAAIPHEAPFGDILDSNIVMTHHVYDAARQHGIRRVVFASTVHVSGFREWGRITSPADPPRPDTYYGLSKLYGEGLGRLYADRFGIEVVNLRIVGFGREPLTPYFLWGWLSADDAVRLVTAALTAPGIGYLTCYGVSRNTRRFYTDDGWAELGYRPVDDAERFADRWPEAQPPALQGGDFTDPGYFGRA